MQVNKGRAKRTVTIVIILLLVSIGVEQLYRTFNGSSDGVVTVNTGAQNESQSVHFVPVEGKYGQLAYRSDFRPVETQKPVNPVLESFNYVRSEGGYAEIAVQVSRLETGSLEDNGGYHYRSLLATRYAKDVTTVGSRSVVIFTERDATVTSLVAFMQQNSLAVSIALTGGTADEAPQQRALLLELVGQWQWK